MLQDFLQAHRNELIARCTFKSNRRHAPDPAHGPLEHGIPLFIEQLIETLQVEHVREPLARGEISTSHSEGGAPKFSEIGGSAVQHGRELLKRGFTVEQVVHDYGDLCQALTELAFERGESIQVKEFRTLNRCLDDAIADAVTEFSYRNNLKIAEQSTQALNERLGVLAHELRNQIHTASLALVAIKSGNVGLSGSTGAVLERSLNELRSLVDRSLGDVRRAAGLPPQRQLIALADFIATQKAAASLEAQARGCILKVTAVDPNLAVEVDRGLLSSAVGNLLQNAFKFTRHGTDVSLRAFAADDRILIEVEDRCGGLPCDTSRRCFCHSCRAMKINRGSVLAYSSVSAVSLLIRAF